MNSDEINCPIKSCQLLSKGCEKPYQLLDLFLMQNREPFGLIFTNLTNSNNNILKITNNVCIKCKNDFQSIELDGFKIINEEKCASTILKKNNLFSELELQYVQGDELKYANTGGITDFFTLFDEKQCPIEKCKIMNIGCL